MSSKFSKNTSVLAQNQLVQWINEAGLSDGNKRAGLLRKIVEVLMHQAPQMLPVYLENVMTYSNDKNTEVKKIVIAFIEELSKLHPQFLAKAMGQLRLLIVDPVVAVQKRSIQAASIIYRNALQWICDKDADISDKQIVWKHIEELKLIVLNMIDNDNEGIRTHSVKFLEEVVLLQTPGEKVKNEFSLDQLPSFAPFIKRQALIEESEHIFDLLLKFHNSQHISSVNLMACMTTLCLVAKLRPQYLPRVIQALEDLHTTLPPTLSQSQVNSVRKHLKMQLINIIKHPSSNDMLPQLAQLLIDIGMTQQEINKVIPKERRNKRVGELKNGDQPTKRFRGDSPQSNSQGSDSNSRSDLITLDDDSLTSLTKPVVTEESILEGLSKIDNVINLVNTTLLSNLPNEMPVTFPTAYKAIPNAGTRTQQKSLAKMILSLVNNDPVLPVPPPIVEEKPSLSDIAAKIPLLRDDDEKTTLKNAVAKLQESTKSERQIENAVSKLMEETRQEHLKEEEKKSRDKEKLAPPQTPTVPKLKQKVKLLRLQEITRPIPKEIKEKLVFQGVSRILRAEKDAAIGGAAQIRAKLITIFASSFTPQLRDLVLDYIFEDPVNHIDLALSWLYEEYAFMQGFNRHPVTLQPKLHEKHDQNYNQLLCALITQIFERGEILDSARDMLLRKIYLEAPLVTEEAADFLKHLVTEEKVAFLALEILEELCIMRPPRASKYVTALLCHVLSDNPEIRDAALKTTVKLYNRQVESMKKVIEKHALLYLSFIALPSPPPEVAGQRGRVPWNDDLYKICLNLVMELFTENDELIIEVGRVYGAAPAAAKRAVLRLLELGAARSPPAARAALRALLRACPPHADTLLTRLVHIHTEREPPSEELVSQVRELYATRVSDVRFLIPVLNGLTKKEILAALPKLIKLNPAVVKEVFNKLLGLQNPNEEMLPITPDELLVALHLIDPSQADLKYIIKATAICFAEKQVYTENVLTSVLAQLLQTEQVPVLMLRSVLQALTLYPGLAATITNVLRQLIDKEVWKSKVAWEGWMKCVERLLPGAAGLLPALPPTARAALSPALRCLVDPKFASQEQQYPPPEQQYPPPEPQYPREPQYIPPEQQYLPPDQFQMRAQYPPQDYNPAAPPMEPLPPGME